MPAHEPPPIGILPAGTANLFASNLGIPSDLPGALDAALHGGDRRLDVGRVNGERFAVMAGAGFDARMIAEADRDLKDRAGRGVHVDRARPRAGRQKMTVAVDGQQWFEGEASCVLVGNFGTITVESRPSTTPSRTTAVSSRRHHRRGAVAMGSSCSGVPPWDARTSPRSSR